MGLVLEPLLGIKELMRITGYSRVSVYRKTADARAGLGQFPIPVTGKKQKLGWRAADVEAYYQARSVPQPPVDVVSPKREPTAKERQNRQKATAEALSRHGININPNKQEK